MTGATSPRLCLVALFVTLLFTPAALAVDELNVASGFTAAEAPLAIRGYDPVAYFTDGQAMIGSARHTAVHQGTAYRFASEANKERFQKRPADYLPQYGGFCAFGVSVNKKFDGDPRLFDIVDGKLYFTLNPEIQTNWRGDISSNVRKADHNWKRIHDKAVASL